MPLKEKIYYKLAIYRVEPHWLAETLRKHDPATG
jgi:hypothetical protein